MDINQIQERLAKITDLPWEVGASFPPERTVNGRECIAVATVTNEHSRDPEAQDRSNTANLDFIANAPQDISDLLSALLAAETRLEAERWRSVETDGLPEEGERVLAFGAYLDCETYGFACQPTRESTNLEFLDRNLAHFRVTHWKPIAPPEGQQQ
jgi:hypothetical protein